MLADLANGGWNQVSWFEGAAALADKDEQIGSHTFTIDEMGIINHSLHEVLQSDLRQPHIDLGGAWYVVSGYSNTTVRFVPGDHKLSQLPEGAFGHSDISRNRC